MDALRGVVCRQKKGGRKRTVTAQCEVRLKMATAGLRQISRSCSAASQNLYFFKRGAKNFRKAENAQKKSDPKSPGLL